MHPLHNTQIPHSHIKHTHTHRKKYPRYTCAHTHTCKHNKRTHTHKQHYWDFNNIPDPAPPKRKTYLPNPTIKNNNIKSPHKILLMTNDKIIIYKIQSTEHYAVKSQCMKYYRVSNKNKKKQNEGTKYIIIPCLRTILNI